MTGFKHLNILHSYNQFVLQQFKVETFVNNALKYS